MDADPNHAETSAAGAKRQRLTPEGRRLLKDFAEQTTKYPDMLQKRQLLDDLRRLPGCGHAQLKTIKGWFQNYRLTTRKKSVDDDDLLFPGLAQNQLEVLRTLVRNNPTPTKDMISIWAARTHAELEDVKMWVSYQQAKAMPRDSSEHSMSASPTTPHPHLPTPARSLSPRVREMSLPLIVTKEEPSPPGTPLLEGWSTHPTQVSHTPSPHRPTGRAREPDVEPHPQSHEGSQLRCDVPVGAAPVKQLAKEINHVMTAFRPTSRLPTTHAEFDAMFKPYEEMMMRFIHNVESGKLQHLGWTPSEFHRR